MAAARSGPAFALISGVYIPRPFLAAICLTALGACSPYRAGSFRSGAVSFPDQRATQGCIDVALSASVDPVAEGPVLDLYLGNRCTESVWIDVPSVEMTAYVGEGEARRVDFFDPGDELKPGLLGGKEQIMVRLELQAPIDSVRVCAQLDRLASSRESGPPQILCTPVEGV